MAKVGHIEVEAPIEKLFWGNVQPHDRFTFSSVQPKKKLISRKRKKFLKKINFIHQISGEYRKLTNEQKNIWKERDERSKKNAWIHFYRHNLRRLKLGLNIKTEPPSPYCVNIGVFYIDDWEANLTQIHPHKYYIFKKKKGTKGQYIAILQEEPTFTDASFSFVYKLKKKATINTPQKFFIVDALINKEGTPEIREQRVPLTDDEQWHQVEQDFSTYPYKVLYYEVSFYFKNFRGILFFDKVNFTHNGKNYIRDPFCNKIERTFTRTWRQIPKNWLLTDGSENSWYKSFFCEDPELNNL